MKHIISIQSSVAYGYVGNRTAVFALETIGIPVIQINTVQFSTHTGYSGYAGEIFSASHINSLLISLENSGLTGKSQALLSGYIGNRETGETILEHVKRLKASNPNFIYCCDPVMGDTPHGLYVKQEIADFFLHNALFEADILIPNHFEACYLSGIAIESEKSARRAVESLHAKGCKIVLITSYKTASDKTIGFFLSTGNKCAILETPRLYFANTPKGTGDLVSSLFLGNYLLNNDIEYSLELTANAVYEILLLTQSQHDTELSLVQGRDMLINPTIQFAVRTL